MQNAESLEKLSKCYTNWDLFKIESSDLRTDFGVVLRRECSATVSLIIYKVHIICYQVFKM